MKKYNKLYIKSFMALSLGIGLPLTIFLMTIAAINNTLDSEAFLFCILPLAAASVMAAYPFLRISYLNNLLAEQEKFGFIFYDYGAKPIYKKSLIFVSDNWIIISGRLAFHKAFINQIMIKKERQYNTKGCPYSLLFECINGETYYYKLSSYSDGKKIKEWFNENK